MKQYNNHPARLTQDKSAAYTSYPHFGGLAGREAGMVGAAMGTATLSHDNRYWAVPVKIGARFHFIVIDTRTGRHETILEADTIGHPEFHPSDNGYVNYLGWGGVAQGGGGRFFDGVVAFRPRKSYHETVFRCERDSRVAGRA